MKATRLLPVTVVVIGLLGLASWWPGGTPAPDAQLVAPVIPVGGDPSALSSTWFCAAGTALMTEAPGHWIVMANPSGETVTARLTAYGADGEVGSEVVEIPASSSSNVAVGELFGTPSLSVMVESPAGELTVEHRLLAAGAADQTPCATTSSDQWYFPSQATDRVVDGTTVTSTSAALLVLFNPFSSDAGVDVTAAVADSVLIPPALAGFVVPAGTVRVVDLGEHIQRRDQIALSVRLRTGRVVAEVVQSFVEGTPEDSGANLGLRLQLGVPDVASRWAFAGGFTGTGVRERLVVYNPGEDLARVVVQVTPVGGASMPPEPFELDVAGRRYGVIDLSAESRVPGVGYHTIQVETDDDTPVVVARVIDITSGPGEAPEVVDGSPAVALRPNLKGGTTSATGSPLVATDWLVPQIIAGESQTPSLVIHNPGSGIVRVSAVTLAGDGEGIVLLDDAEVEPGDGLVVPLASAELPAGNVTVSLTASAPILVERVVTFVGQQDLSMGLAIPLRRPDGSQLTLISEM